MKIFNGFYYPAKSRNVKQRHVFAHGDNYDPASFCLEIRLLISVEIKIRASEIGRIAIVSDLKFAGKYILTPLIDNWPPFLLAHHFQESFIFFFLEGLWIFFIKTYKSNFAKVSLKDWHLSLPEQTANCEPVTAETKTNFMQNWCTFTMFFYPPCSLQCKTGLTTITFKNFLLL